MTSTEKQEILWGDIGGPLADLLRYEREIGYCEHAGYALLSTIVHEAADSTWRQFLLAEDNFAAVVGQVIAISDKESKNPKKVLDSIRELVNAAYSHAQKCTAVPENIPKIQTELLMSYPREVGRALNTGKTSDTPSCDCLRSGDGTSPTIPSL